MIHDFKVSVDIGNLELSVVGQAIVAVENDGIGAYEYWGAKGFDRGQNSFEITSLYIDSITEEESGFEFAESKEIRQAVMKAIEKDLSA